MLAGSIAAAVFAIVMLIVCVHARKARRGGTKAFRVSVRRRTAVVVKAPEGLEMKA